MFQKQIFGVKKKTWGSQNGHGGQKDIFGGFSKRFNSERSKKDLWWVKGKNFAGGSTKPYGGLKINLARYMPQICFGFTCHHEFFPIDVACFRFRWCLPCLRLQEKPLVAKPKEVEHTVEVVRQLQADQLSGKWMFVLPIRPMNVQDTGFQAF